MSVWLRAAIPSDTDDLLRWRNDPVTLACFRSTAVVTRDAHEQWVKYNVIMGYPEHRVLIAETDKGSVGVVRFDAHRNDVMAFDVSIIVAPEWRHRGFGGEMLRQACAIMPEFTLVAEVRRSNEPSCRLFEGCGFDFAGADPEFFRYRREPLS
jgi:RimJ/RimL family protein N-acetyltransferase